MNNHEIRSRLETLSEKQYKEFSQALIPGSREILGVRIPTLRVMAKEIAKGDWQTYLQNACDDSFEEVNLQGFVIGYVKADWDTLLPYIKRYVDKINDWSLCDGFCATLKVARKYKNDCKSLLRSYSTIDGEFKQRFVAVMLMNYYLEPVDMNETLTMLDSLDHPGYYRKMGVAWAIATAMAKQRDVTMEYFLSDKCTLDNFTYNKSIQKMLESYRISEEDKNFLRTQKR